MEGDRISLLPECLLGTIVALLPVRDAARTMALSHRWRPIWPSLPLDLLASDLDDRTISAILASHGGDGAPIRRFCAGRSTDHGTSPRWLQALLAQRRVQGTLVLGFTGARKIIPLDLLACGGASLRRLRLLRCRLLDPQAPPMAFPRLDLLELVDLEISEASLHLMIAACPALRNFRLYGVCGLRRLAPRSRTLVKLCISPLEPLDEISFSGTPNIETILLPDHNMSLLNSTAILEPDVPGKLLEVALELNLWKSTTMPKRSMPFITKLVLLTMELGDGEDLRKAARTLSLFPSLQHLGLRCHGLSGSKDDEAFEHWQPMADTIVCLEKHLKHVHLLVYHGTRGELEFAMFITARAQVLKDMQIFLATNWSDERVNCHRQLICAASSEAQVTFHKNIYVSVFQQN